jgi:hypothetical protein
LIFSVGNFVAITAKSFIFGALMSSVIEMLSMQINAIALIGDLENTPKRSLFFHYIDGL